MFAQIENVQQGEDIVTSEVDAKSGWVLEHHSQTRTWDVRKRVDDLDAEALALTSDLQVTQSKLNLIADVKADLQKQIADAAITP